ncbi:DMT family transporter [Rhodobacteraceae bacterium NNCM2]|nr:DMT family transporter [Coraliihabitans acroporae]
MTDRKGSLLKAVACSMLGILLLDMMGLLVKLLVDEYPAQQLAVWRNVFSMIPAVIVLSLTPGWRWRRDQILVPRYQLALLRGGFITIAQTSFYFSLSFMAFATASALTFTMSLFVTALSGPVLGNKVGPWRWGAVLIGFFGVMLILRPGSDAFSIAALLPVCAALFYAITTVTAQLFPSEVPTPAINLFTNIAALIGATLLTALTTGFTPIASVTDFFLMAAMGMFGGVGVLFLIFAYRMTEPSNLSPFDYTGILFAFIFGWVFFGEAPVDQLFPGVFFIIAGGLLILWRERVNAAKDAAPVKEPAE